MSSNPKYIEHLLGANTPFRLRVTRDDDALDLTGLTVLAGLESAKYTGQAASGVNFHSWSVTAHGATGTISGTIPWTGFAFTGDAVLRIWASGAPKQFIGSPHAVKVVQLSGNWI